MTLRCEPGDLAVVIDGPCAGLFVDVQERGPDHPLHGWPTWFTKCRGPCKVTLVKLPTGEALGNQIAPRGSLVLFCDRQLKPIRPPPIDASNKTKTPERTPEETS